MRGLVFTTGTPDTIKLVRSFEALGHDTVVIQYDVGPTSGPRQIDMLTEVERVRPDVIVYIGAIKEIHHSWVPSTGELCEINGIAPMVHICSDAADPPWWASLEDYDKHGAFALQVAIDGAQGTPLNDFEKGMTALTPLHPDWFPEVEWEKRVVHCGFSGGVGYRTEILGTMQNHGLLTHFGNGEHNNPYENLCLFYTTCKTVVNDARTGSQARRHMKGRFCEAAMAGAIVIEPADSIARSWFTANEDFMEFNNWGDAPPIVRDVIARGEHYAVMGKRMREKMIDEHSAPVFWKKVFGRIGL